MSECIDRFAKVPPSKTLRDRFSHEFLGRCDRLFERQAWQARL
jgi:hypothetical protein